MANDNEIKIKLKAEDEASPTLKAAVLALTESLNRLNQTQLAASEAAEKNKESSGQLNNRLVNLAAGVSLLKEGLHLLHAAYEVLHGHVEKAIEESLKSERATNQLKGAIASAGLEVGKLSKELSDYAKEQQDLTGVSDETIKTHIAMGLQMGLSAQKAKEMELASRKLAAATGQDLDSAFQVMQASLAGQARGLTRVIPQIKELGTAQLQTGKAIEIVNQKLNAQYELYEKSLTASLHKVHTAYEDLYESVGNAITQSPALQAALNGLAKMFSDLGTYIENNKDEVTAFVDQGIMALVNVLPTVVSGIGLVDQSITYLVNTIRMAMAGATGLAQGLTSIVGALPDSVLKSLGVDIKSAETSLESFQNALFQNVDESMKSLDERQAGLEKLKKITEDYARSVDDAGQKGVKAHKDATAAADEHLQKESDLNAAIRNRGKMYGDIAIGTEEQRKLLKAGVEDRDKDLKDFKDYLDAKKRLALTAAQEQEMEVNKAKAEALKGSGGSAETTSKAQSEMDAERKKMAELEALREQNLLSEEQYNQARLASMQRYNEAELEAKMAHQEQIANLTGESDEAYAAKLAIEEERYQLELQNKLQRAQEEELNQQQINAIKEQSEMDHQARINEIRETQIQNDIKRNEKLHNDWAVTLGKIRLEQEKHGKILGTIRGIQATEEYRGAQQTLTDLASLRNSHSKKAFEVGKAAATAQATVNTFMAATAAYAAMAGIPIVGPALGAIAAAAAIAAGIVNIQNIQAQKFNGGQADEGMDSVPGGLAGKSFILSQGERVVQPSANRDLRDFLAREKAESQGGGGGNYSITLNYSGSGSKDDAVKMADIVIEEIRARSERGAPIMSERGLTKA